jgi:hypothetical protein
MNTYKLALAALLLLAAGASNAGVPVIELAPSTNVLVQAPHAGPAGPELVGQSAPSALAQAAAPSGMLVAVRPQPSFGALLLLVVGCIVYQGRRRRQGLALRPERTLFDGLAHAPAHA